MLTHCLCLDTGKREGEGVHYHAALKCCRCGFEGKSPSDDMKECKLTPGENAGEGLIKSERKEGVQNE